MKIVIHDIKNNFLQETNETKILDSNKNFASCKGCFKCWIKNAGFCNYKDYMQHIGSVIGNSDEIIIISKIYYGCYSSQIKKVFDRAISTSLPFFTYRKKETHHIDRYGKKRNLKVYFYGECDEFEKETAKQFVKRHAINCNAENFEIKFFQSDEEVIHKINQKEVNI